MESQTRASMGMGSAKKGMIEGKALAICFSLIHGLAFISYIYIWYPPPKPMQTSILLVFTVNFLYFGTDFVPIKFEAPTVGKLKN